MQSVDQFFDRTRSRNYQCFDFAAEVWAHLTGEQLEQMPTLCYARQFVRMTSPAVDPCLVIMTHGNATPHMGVYYDGLVIHLAADCVRRESIAEATRGFKKVRFIR